MSSLALWRYTFGEVGQISHPHHADAGCFPAPWDTFLISTVDPKATTIRQQDSPRFPVAALPTG